MNKGLSITTRLYLGFLALLLVALVTLGTLATVWFMSQQSASLDQFLDTEARSVANRLEIAFSSARSEDDLDEILNLQLQRVLESRLNRIVPYKTTLIVFNDRGLVLARSNRALDLSVGVPKLGPGEFLIENVRDVGPPHRVISAAFPLGPGRYGLFRIACSLSSLDVSLLSFLTSLAVVLGGSLLLLSTLGLGLLRLTLAPVKDMALAAGTISEKDLAARIPEPAGTDEIARLARTLNGLISRLEKDYAFQERLVGELTHQLKTPLTILRGRNELGLTTKKGAEELRELVEDNLSDIDSMVNLLNTLLELARLDSRIDRLDTKPVKLRRFLEDLGAEMEPLWSTRDLDFQLVGPEIELPADPEALRQIFLNIYDNACQFAPPGTALKTHWSVSESLLAIAIWNKGPPIPDGEQELIFKRFFRSATQAQSHRGSGLGLSIARSLVQLHRGTIIAQNPPEGGASFEIRLPLV